MIDQLGNGLLLGIIISVASVALSLLYGVTRIVNFAHGEIIALGAIVTLFFSGPIDSRVLFLERFSPLGMSFVTSAIIGIIFCGVFGGLLELLLFRPLRKAEVGNIAVLVVTIGLSIFIRHLYLLFASGRVQNFPLDLERRQTYLFFEGIDCWLDCNDSNWSILNFYPNGKSNEGCQRFWRISKRFRN